LWLLGVAAVEADMPVAEAQVVLELLLDFL
jgi:hypothetical protein